MSDSQGMTFAVAYGMLLLSLPVLSAVGRTILSRWIARKNARYHAALEAAERRHQAGDARVYGEE